MASSNTRTVLRQEILNRHPIFGFAFSADSVATGSVTSITRFQHSQYGSEQFKDYWIYRYGRSGDDIFKRATTLSGAVLSHGGSNYSNTSDLDMELWSIDPREVNASLALAQRKAKSRHLIALTGGRIATGPAHDYDMELSGQAYWDGSSGSSAVSNITPTKSTTDLYSGSQALVLTASGTSGSCRGEKMRCQPGQSFYSAAIVRADVGTVGFTWYNVTGSAVFSGQAEITYTGEDWALLERYDTVPSGCEEMQPRFSLSGATDIGIADTIFGPYFQGARMFNIPTWMDETYEVKALRPSSFGISLASGTYDAYSRDFKGDWIKPHDFVVESLQKDGNPTRLQLFKELPRQPVWISAERDLYAAGETLASESATSTGDIDEVIAYTMEDLLENKLIPRNPGDEGLLRMLAEYKSKAVIEEIARPSLPVKQKTQHIRLRA